MSTKSLTKRTAKSPAQKAVSSRLEWVDVAKGIGIILVVIGHSINGLAVSDVAKSTNQQMFAQLPHDLIYSFHMPLFFAISGFFAASWARRSVLNASKSKLLSLAVPYLVFSSVQIFAHIVGSSLVNYPLEISGVLQIFISNPYETWFLYTLFFMFAFFLIWRKILALVRFPEKFFFVIDVLLIAVFLVVVSTVQLGVFDFLVRPISNFPYFLAGVVLFPLFKKTSTLAFDAAFFLISTIVWLSLFISPVDVGRPTEYLIALPGIAACLFLSKVLTTVWGKTKLLQGLSYCGLISIGIFLLHAYFLQGWRIFCLQIVHFENFWAIFVSGVLLSLPLSVIAFRFITRFRVGRIAFGLKVK